MKTSLVATMLFLLPAPLAARVAPDWDALDTLRDNGHLEEDPRELRNLAADPGPTPSSRWRSCGPNWSA